MTMSFTTHIEIVMPKTRKRPVTDDMAQMCADLKVEPYTPMSEALARISKQIDKALLNGVRYGVRRR